MKLLNLYALFGILIAQAQVPISEVVQDKIDMADSYYGKFKYNGDPFTGKAIDYHENGNIKTLRHFKNGMYDGMWTEWYANGNRKFQGDRRKNKGQGLTKWWFENGQLKKQGTYDMDKQQGVVVRWHDNGQLQSIRYYEQDKATGGWSTFDRNGDVFDEGDNNNLFYRSFFEARNSDDYERASPSFTQDGKTMVFVKYKDWMKKLPFIGKYQDGKWVSEQLSFVNYVYNLAISPDGNRIIYKKYMPENQDEISKTYVVDKVADSWGNPREVTSLYDINAGYFNFTPDGTLFIFARKPKTGLYYSKPDTNAIYSKPIWISDDISPGKPTSFDVFMHPDKNKLIVTQVGFTPEQREAQSYDGNGIYYYKKINGNWERIKRLPLAYGWGSSVLPDGRFVYVRNSDIYYVSLEDLGIDW